MKQHKAAELILAYYQVKDSDPTHVDYLLNLDSITRVCMDRFRSIVPDVRTDDNPIPVVILFHILIRLDQQILALDSIGAEESAASLTEAHDKIDTDLRAVVSKITRTDITNGSTYDPNFLGLVESNVFHFEFKKNS